MKYIKYTKYKIFILYVCVCVTKARIKTEKSFDYKDALFWGLVKISNWLTHL